MAVKGGGNINGMHGVEYWNAVFRNELLVNGNVIGVPIGNIFSRIGHGYHKRVEKQPMLIPGPSVSSAHISTYAEATQTLLARKL